MSKKPEISEHMWAYDLIHRRQWPEWYKRTYEDGWTPVLPRTAAKRKRFLEKKREKMAKYYREGLEERERLAATVDNKQYEEMRRRYEGHGSKTRRKRKVRRKSRKSRSKRTKSRRRKSRKSRRRR